MDGNDGAEHRGMLPRAEAAPTTLTFLPSLPQLTVGQIHRRHAITALPLDNRQRSDSAKSWLRPAAFRSGSSVMSRNERRIPAA